MGPIDFNGANAIQWRKDNVFNSCTGTTRHPLNKQISK